MLKFVILAIVLLAGSLTGVLLPCFANYLICRKEEPEEPARIDMIFFNAETAPQNASMGSNHFMDRLKGIFEYVCVSVKENKKNTWLVMILNGTGWLFAAVMVGFNFQSIQKMVIVSTALIISIMDIKFRIIPNTMIAILFISSLLFSFSGVKDQSILLHALGLAIGLAFLGIPFLLNSSIGAGDVKYLTVIGLCLGYPDIIKAILISSSILLAWLLLLLATKKGGLKTKFAMGPFLSIGFVITLLF